MRLFLTASFASLLLAAPVLAQGVPGPASPPIAGTVKSFDGKTLEVSATGGAALSVAVTPATRITLTVPKTVADIKPGDFIASGGTRGPDGVLRANEIRIFSAPGGEGQFPMAQPGQTMTNATVTQVMTDATVKQVGGGKAPVIKLSFHGAGAPGSANCTGRSADAPGGAGKGCVGETEFEVPANVKVVAQLPGDASMLKPGAKVSVGAANGQATRITISQ